MLHAGKKIMEALHYDLMKTSINIIGQIFFSFFAPNFSKRKNIIGQSANLHRKFKVSIYIDHNYIQQSAKACLKNNKTVLFLWCNQANLKYEDSNTLAFSHLVTTASALPSMR